MMRQWFNGKMLLYQRSAGGSIPPWRNSILFLYYILNSKIISESKHSSQDANRHSSVSYE